MADSNNHSLRDDYREIIDLSLLVLGAPLPPNYHFKVSGSTSNARFMSRIIGSFKMFLFRDTLEANGAITSDEIQKFQEISLFAAMVYVPNWNYAGNILDAPSYDLAFLKKIHDYKKIDEEAAQGVLNKMTNNLFYLDGELVVLGIFSEMVANEIKDKMRSRLIALRCKSFPALFLLEPKI